MANHAKWATNISDDARMNKMTVIPNTGTYLSGLTKTQHGLLICTQAGSGLLLDHVYLCSADGTSLIDISSIASHTHSGSSDGGSLIDVFGVNNHIIDLVLTKTTDLYEATWTTPVYWIKAVTSTGSVENKTDGTTGERSIRLRPNATSGSGATISYPHLKLNFALNSVYTTKLQIETATSLALHTGVGADDVTAADSNTRKYQVEVCTVTNANYWLRSATGSANSSSDSGIAITANRVGISAAHFPTAGTPRVDMYIDANTVFSKTTNIPISGATADNNLIKHSVKNSTGADRPLLVYGTRLTYGVLDSWAT
jgi:hypothetical protein